MNAVEIIQFAFSALRDRQLRSALTILMVVIGATLIVALNGMSAGMNVFITEQFSSLAPDVLIVTPAPLISGAGGAMSNPVDLNTQTVKTLERIKDVEEVIPIIQRSAKLNVGGSTLNVGVMGLDQSKGTLITPTLEYAEGTYVRPNDSVGAVIGYEVKYPPGRTTPLVKLGQTISLEYTSVEVVGGEQKQVTEKRSFTVRGTLEDTGGTGLGVNMNRMVTISLAAANAFFNSGGKYDMIMIVTKDFSLNDQVEHAIRERYGQDIGVTSFKTLTDTIQSFISGFAMFFVAIAAVSLVVAAVGVITTLFTSVIERTREIGVLKALGFRNSSVMMLFISEAAIIGIIGGAIGLMLGAVAGTFLLGGLLGGTAMGLKPAFLPSDLVFVWLFSVAISSLAGLYPAWRAARLDPITSLRKE